jgi:hypothetical protein
LRGDCLDELDRLVGRPDETVRMVEGCDIEESLGGAAVGVAAQTLAN